MELIKNVRLKIGYLILAKKLARTKRKVHYSNFGLVKKMGIVWDASNLDEFACLSRFHQKMLDRDIEVKVLGYFPGKDLPDQYTAIRYLTCIRKKEINFFYQPLSPECDTFLKTRFDILIDINFKKLFQLNYISTLSGAGFKVGLFGSEKEASPFDLMMDIKPPVDVEYYLNQIIQYLEIINAGTV